MAAQMAAIVDPSIFVGAMELLSLIWMEVAMAVLSAVVYFTFSGSVPTGRGAKVEGSGEQAKPPDSKGPCYSESSTAYEPAWIAAREGNVREAMALLKNVPGTITGCMPNQFAMCFLLSTVKSPIFDDLLVEFQEVAGRIGWQVLEAALVEAAKRKDLQSCRRLHAIAGVMLVPKTQRMWEALAKVYALDAASLRALLEEAEAPLAKPVAKALLESCISTKNVDLAAEVFEKIDEHDAASLRECVEKSTTKSGSGAMQSVAYGSCKEAVVLAKTIRVHGHNRDLESAINAFERYPKRHAAGPILLNSLLDACIECADVDKAIEYFSHARKSEVVDVVSYNTMMKGYLSIGDEDSAEVLLQELSKKGIAATHASYHALLNARVVAGDLRRAWVLVNQMESSGTQANAVTCSILLKSPKSTSAADFLRVMKLVDALKEPMDEVLFSSVAESCIHHRRLDLLSKQRKSFKCQGVQGAPIGCSIYGSMIKSYGQARDVARVWELWGEMADDGVKPTCVTLGCMVEALVANRRTREAWQLVQGLWRDEGTQPLLNTVIYSTILKGFAASRESEKLMSVYEEMLSRKIQPNTITYNTILNAFAQSGDMHRVPALLEDMKAAVPPVEPDVVTYSTIVKGFCSCGSLDLGLAILKEMKADGKHEPDEVMYNSLLNGCAKEQRLEDALWLLEDMKSAGVVPSNYTLSMLVKLMGRCRRLGQAFSMVDVFTKEYGVKINIQVYTCLIQACFINRQVSKALAVHDQILKEGVIADEMTYTALVRGCLHAGSIDKAVVMARHAYGLMSGQTAAPGINAQCLEELLGKLGGAKSEAAKELRAASSRIGQHPGSSKRNAAEAPWHKRTHR